MAIAAGRPGAGNGVVCRVLRVLLAAALGMPPLPTAAGDSDTQAKLPRFVSLRSDQVNLRVGPG